MKIAIFVAQLKGGGAERMMVNLANCLADCGNEVHLICACFEGPYCQEVNDKVHVVDFKKQKVSTCILDLYNFLKNKKPECLISTQSHAIMTAVIAAKFFSFKTPLIIREATTPSEAALRAKKGIVSNLRIAFLKFLYKKADKYIAVSSGVKDDINNYYNVALDKIHVVPNPVITKDIDEKMLFPVDHPFFNNGNIIVMGVGRIHTSKDFSTLIRAFAIAKETLLKLKLIILGDTEFNIDEFKKIRHLIDELRISEDVSFTGFVSNPFSYLKKADVFVLSSRYEGMPGVIIQAMYCGCQVVSTDCKNGPAEILLDGKLGRLVMVGDYTAMAREITDITIHPYEPNLLKQRALDFTDNHSTEHYLRVINSLYY